MGPSAHTDGNSSFHTLSDEIRVLLILGVEFTLDLASSTAIHNPSNRLKVRSKHREILCRNPSVTHHTHSEPKRSRDEMQPSPPPSISCSSSAS